MACLVQNTSVVDSNNGSGSWSPLYGGISSKTKLNSDAIQIIHCIYCKDCRMEKLAAEQARRTAQAGATQPSGGNGKGEPGPVSPTSPQVSLDQGSLHLTMDKHKETLKRKLMLRRSVNELVERGIYPSLKTPPAFAEKQKQLERAKTGDLLRHKIQQRPDRNALIQQHILEDTGTIDPSLIERQRLLKRARLVDGLNDKLAHRPGPLELVQGNILVSSDELTEAIKDGKLHFNKTCEGEDPNNRLRHFTFDDESASSDGIPSPQLDESSLSDISSPSSLISSSEFSSFQKSPPLTFTSAFSGKSLQLVSPPPSSFLAGLTTTTPSHDHLVPSTSAQSSNISLKSVSPSSLGGSSNNKPRPKKQKHKPTSKAKVIKFHEYKGPPNVVKSQSASQASKDTETPYHIMLQQQQLFLQWQLEFKQKNNPFTTSAQKLSQDNQTMMMSAASQSPSIVTAAVTNMIVSAPIVSTAQVVASQPLLAQPQAVHSQPAIAQPTVSLPLPPPPPPPAPPLLAQQTQVSTIVTTSASRPIPNQGTKANPVSVAALSLPKITVNLEDLKVADLKAELKKRNLPVSGSKPQLIERLRPYTEVSAGGTPNNLMAHSPASSKNPSPSPPAPTPTPTPPPMLLQIKKEPFVSDNSMQCTLSSPPVMTSFGPISHCNASVKEEPMSTGGNSPPISPSMDPHTMPMSPDLFDMVSPPTLTFGSTFLGTSQLPASASLNSTNSTTNLAQPMAIDRSRPPSAVASELNGGPAVDVEPMEVGSNLTDFKTITLPIASLPVHLPKTSVATTQHQINTSTALIQKEQLLQLQAQLQAHMQMQAQLQQQSQQQQQSVQLKGQPQVLQFQPQALISQPQVQLAPAGLTQISPSSLAPHFSAATLQGLGINLCTTTPTVSSSTLTSLPSTISAVDNQDVVRAQAKQIEDLQRQLQESQIKLQLQVLQQQHLLLHQQQQQQQLLQVRLPTAQTSPNSLLTQRHMLSPTGPSLIAQPQISPQSPTDLASALQQQQQSLLQSSVQPPATVLNTIQISLSNAGLQTSGNGEFKLQTQTSTPSTVISSVGVGQTAATQTLPQVLPQSQKSQIPVHLLSQTQQQIQQQLQQNGQSLLNSSLLNSRVTTPGSNKFASKANINEFLKNQVLNQGLHKSLSYPATITSAQNNSLPMVFTATPTKMTTSTSTIGQPQVGRTGSCLDGQQKLQISRSASNPFFNIPFKEPPKYDEAVRSKQHTSLLLNDTTSLSNGSSTDLLSSQQQPPTKSQAVDDVLEILIRNGDLPPSAADEPLPTPKATEAQSMSTLPPVSSISQAMSLPMSLSVSSSIFTIPITSLSPPASVGSVGSPMPLLHTNTVMSASESDGVSGSPASNKGHLSDSTPPPIMILPPTTIDNRLNLNSELLDLTEMLSGDLNTMEWTSGSGFVGLDLTEASMHLGSSGILADNGSGLLIENSLTVPTNSYRRSTSNDGANSVNGSEPDLTTLGLHDGDGDGPNIQIDVSDWLDVIMPSTGLTPLSTNAPVSFSADPILTPKTQQEVLDLFNFDDGDFSAPSEPGGGLSWDKLTEPNAGSS